MQDVIWNGRPTLRKPVMVCAFNGWNDAGEAASAAVSFIRGQLRRRGGRLDRPRGVLRLHGGAAHGAPDRGRRRARSTGRSRRSRPRPCPGAEGDLVMLQATEPSLRWRRYTDNLVATARELDVRMVITLGALLADVPHTRPVAITGHRLRALAGRPARLPAHELRGADRHRRRAAQHLRQRRHPVGEPVGVGPALRGRRAQPEGGAGAGARLRGDRRRGRRRGRAGERGGGLRAPGQRGSGERPRGQGVRRAARDGDGRGRPRTRRTSRTSPRRTRSRATSSASCASAGRISPKPASGGSM